MKKYQKEFIEFAIKRKALCFGEYKLKSGRISPYFFNTGLFNDGESLAKLGRFYAEALQNSEIKFDMIVRYLGEFAITYSPNLFNRHTGKGKKK